MQFRRLRYTLAAAIAALSLSAIHAQDSAPQTPQQFCEAAVPANDPETREYTQPEEVLEDGVDYRAIFCTSSGAVYIDLFEEFTPITVNSFVFLAQNGYYNNTIFHRVIQDFMAQGGDPTGTGTGGPGYQFEDEFVPFLTFEAPGWLAMANAGPATNGSQFFITTAPTTHLNYRHTIFGEVLEGQENVLNIELRDPAQADAPATTLDTVIIVDDPAVVETTYVAPEKPTSDAATEAFSLFNEQLGIEGITVTGGDAALTIEEAVANAPEASREALEAYLTENGLNYRLQHSIVNDACNVTEFAFIDMSFTFDAFADDESAAAAYDSGFLAQQAEADGLTLDESGDYYITSLKACGDTVDAVKARAYILRGSYIETIEVTVQSVPDFTAQDVLAGIAQPLYEQTLGALLRSEIR